MDPSSSSNPPHQILLIKSSSSNPPHQILLIKERGDPKIVLPPNLIFETRSSGVVVSTMDISRNHAGPFIPVGTFTICF
jgi:hypothetical protein